MELEAHKRARSRWLGVDPVGTVVPGLEGFDRLVVALGYVISITQADLWRRPRSALGASGVFPISPNPDGDYRSEDPLWLILG